LKRAAYAPFSMTVDGVKYQKPGEGRQRHGLAD
jgi:hypothetical protein